MRRLLVTLSNGKSSEIEVPEELSQEEVIAQIESNVKQSFEGVDIAGIEQLGGSEQPQEPTQAEPVKEEDSFSKGIVRELMPETMAAAEEGAQFPIMESMRDLFSLPGRALSTNVEHAYQGATGQEIDPTALARTAEESDFVGSVTRDPTNLPAMAIPVARAIKPLARVISKAPTFLRPALSGAAEGLAEEVVSGAIRGDVDPTNMALGTGIGGTFGGIGGKMGSIARDKFGAIMPNAAFRNMPDATKEADISKVYKGLEGYGGVDYDLPSRLKDIRGEQSRLGQMKQQAIMGSQEVAEEFPSVRQEMLEGAQSPFDDEVSRVTNLVTEGRAAPDDTQKYLAELEDVKNKYLKDVRVDLPEEITVENAIESINQGVAGANEWQTDLLKMFETRKTMDKSLKNAYKRAGAGKGIPEKDEAIWFGRTYLNKRIDNTVNAIEDRLQAQVQKTPNHAKSIEALEKMQGLKKRLEEAKDLPNLYRQEEILEKLGGGRIEKTSSELFRGGGLKSFLLPQSGIRERQMSGAVQSIPLQHLGKDMYREENKAPTSFLRGI